MTAISETGAVWTIGEVAQAYGITVRTLHHYDAIGLLRPSERSRAGYRRYTDADIRRLATIVGYRRLGFSLAEVGDLLDGDAPLVDHLRRQREAVSARLEELRELARALDTAWESEMNSQMSDTELRDLFGDGFDESYAAEAEERWGETDAWQQSRRRTASYGRADWEAIKAEQDEVQQGLLAAYEAGEPADGDAATAAAEAHRQHIERWFYDLPHEGHRRLGEMYLADERFRRTYEDLAPGLAEFVAAAIAANADRHA